MPDDHQRRWRALPAKHVRAASFRGEAAVPQAIALSLTSTTNVRKLLAAVTAGFLLTALAAGAQPSDAGYPNRLIKIIVSAPAGGGLDVAARIIAERLRVRFGQPIIVENRPGASGNTGTEAVAAAEPDGYTLLAAQPTRPPLSSSGRN